MVKLRVRAKNVDGDKPRRKKRKKIKVISRTLEIHPDVKKIIAVRGNKNRAVRDLSQLLTQRAGYPVRVIYHRSLDRKFDAKEEWALPFMRIVETDTPLGDNATFLFIVISDGIFKTEKIFAQAAQGMYLRW